MKNVIVKMNTNLQANKSSIFFEIISIQVSVSFYCDNLSIYRVSVFTHIDDPGQTQKACLAVSPVAYLHVSVLLAAGA